MLKDYRSMPRSAKDSISCPKCRRPITVCPGNCGGGSEADSDKKDDQESYSALALVPSLGFIFDIVNQTEKEFSLFKLMINKSMNLTFTGKSYLSQRDQDDLHEFYETVKRAFESFKLELRARGVEVENFRAEITNNAFMLRIPNTDAFNEFIQRLVSYKYLPANLLHQAKPATIHSSPAPLAAPTKSKPLPAPVQNNPLPTPLSMVPRPPRTLAT